MKLLLSIVEDRAAGRVADALVEAKYGVTRVNTQGGFLRRGNATLLVGVDDERVDDAIRVMRQAYGPREGEPSGPVFVIGVDRSLRV